MNRVYRPSNYLLPKKNLLGALVVETTVGRKHQKRACFIDCGGNRYIKLL